MRTLVHDFCGYVIISLLRALRGTQALTRARNIGTGPYFVCTHILFDPNHSTTLHE